MKEHREANEKSSACWRFKFENLPKPSNKTNNLWIVLIEWMFQQNVQMIIDFTQHCQFKYQILDNA